MEPVLGPVRPPSEASSLLVRVTGNCPWNRCKFCHFYKGHKFELRPLDAVKQDILAAKAVQNRILEDWPDFCGEIEDNSWTPYHAANSAFPNVSNWLRGGGRSAFLQDANTLIVPPDDLARVIEFLKQTLPSITRITTYGRSQTAAHRTVKDLSRLREAGLSRIHIGLESGYDPLLTFMKKGCTVADHIKGGRNVVASGISLCVYVVLGLGGARMWRSHAVETARVINEIGPEFVRLRTLSVTSDMPLSDEVASGNFVRSTDEQILAEEKLFIESLACHTNVVSDHMTNLLQEVEGRLPEDKHRVLATIERFEALAARDRAIFRLGRRLGLYYKLDDLNDPIRRRAIEAIAGGLSSRNETGLDEDVARELLGKFM